MLTVAAGHELEFLHPLPVRRLWASARQRLRRSKPSGLPPSPKSLLRRWRLSRAALVAPSAVTCRNFRTGSDDRPVVTGGEAKSISVEETFARDLTDSRQVEEALLHHCDRLSARLTPRA